MEVLLELDHVTVRFSDMTVLSNVSLSVEKGESLVVVGPSGQGKSVLLKIMAGLLIPTQGEVRWGGESVVTLRGKDRLRWMRRMGMLFQKNALFDSLTVGENVAFPLREMTKLGEDEIQKKVEYFLQAVDLGHAVHLFPSEISGGMQKRLGIARALALDPEIIFYDDPTAGLDPITSRKIIQLIQDLRSRMKSTIITITNDMNRAYQLAGRIVMVVDHELIVTGGIEETKANKDPRVAQFIRGALQGPLTVMA